MKLFTMCKALREVIDTSPGSGLSFEEQIGMIVDREWSERENRRLARRLKDAKIGRRASLEDVICDPARGIDKSTLRQMATCQWVKAKQNVIAVGLTGIGKSFLGAALAEAACRQGYRALFVRVPRLLEELSVARASGAYGSTLANFAKLDVLVLDDFLLAPMSDTERRDLLELLEDRYDKSSTVITSQVPTKSWHDAFNDPTIGDAICDRIVHNAHVLSLRGPSLRKQKGLTLATLSNPEPST